MATFSCIVIFLLRTHLSSRSRQVSCLARYRRTSQQRQWFEQCSLASNAGHAKTTSCKSTSAQFRCW